MASTKTVIKESQPSTFTTGKALFFLGGGVLLVGGVWYLIGRANAQNVSNDLINDPNKQLATRLRNALKSGWFNSTSVEEVYKIAPLIADFPKVSQAYADLYNDNLAKDLETQLEPAELTRFMSLATSGKRDAQLKAEGKIPTPTGFLINVTKLNANGKAYYPGLTVKGLGQPAPSYIDPSRYPSAYKELAFKATGNWVIKKIYGFFDDLDKSKNTYLYQVQQGNTLIWQRYGCFSV